MNQRCPHCGRWVDSLPEMSMSVVEWINSAPEDEIAMAMSAIRPAVGQVVITRIINAVNHWRHGGERPATPREVKMARNIGKKSMRVLSAAFELRRAR